MTDDPPTVWIDILSDPAVSLAAHAWGKGKAETWGIISRHIDAGNFRQRMTLYQFQANVKIIADYQFFQHCPVCKTPHRPSDLSCSNCRVDLNKARRYLIEEEFKNFPIPPAPTPPPVLPKPKEVRTVIQPKPKDPPTQPRQPVPLAPPPERRQPAQALDQWLTTQWKNSTLFRWAVALIVIYILGTFIPNDKTDTSAPSGPIYPGDQTYLEGDEYRAEQFENYDPRAEQDYYPNITLEPDEPYYFNEPEEIDSTTPCLIKGNISDTTLEKIYHLPGQKFYDTTIIEPSQGERYFCTEQEAQAAGWRKSRQ